MKLRLAVLFALALTSSPSPAMIGGVPASPAISAQTVMLSSTRGSFCSAAVIARDLVLTAAHCVQPGADYAAVVFDGGAPSVVKATRIVLHPRFDPSLFKARKPSPDLAIVKLSAPLPASFRTAKIEREPFQPKPGDRFTLAGFGVTSESDPQSAGKIRSVSLPAIGNTIDSTGIIMVRLSAGAEKTTGACIGDSGGPVFRAEKLAAIIGFATGRGDRECGSVTGATLVAQQFDWIAATVKLLGAKLTE